MCSYVFMLFFTKISQHPRKCWETCESIIWNNRNKENTATKLLFPSAFYVIFGSPSFFVVVAMFSNVFAIVFHHFVFSCDFRLFCRFSLCFGCACFFVGFVMFSYNFAIVFHHDLGFPFLWAFSRFSLLFDMFCLFCAPFCCVFLVFLEFFHQPFEKAKWTSCVLKQIGKHIKK